MQGVNFYIRSILNLLNLFFPILKIKCSKSKIVNDHAYSFVKIKKNCLLQEGA
jgi:hypothetical protein